MDIVKLVNTGMSFLLEVAGIIAISYWGFSLKNLGNLRYIIGIIAPIFIIVIWVIWCAPASVHRLENTGLIILKSIIFIFASFCLWHSKHSALAIILLALFVMNIILSYFFKTL